MRCFPNQIVNMQTMTLHRAKELEAKRSRDPTHIRSAASAVVHAVRSVQVPEAVTGLPFRVWTHEWQQIALYHEEDIELPGTFLYPHIDHPAAVVIHFDDQGRNRLLHHHGLLSQTARFLSFDKAHHAVFSVDLRGWGDSAPAIYPYDIAPWGGLDRYLAYTSAALGDSMLAMRIRDALVALSYLRTRSEIRHDRIVVTGCGLGGVVALHVAAITGKDLAAVVVWDSLVSFQALLEAPGYAWPADAFLPNVLLHYDLPDLASALPCSVQIVNPRDGNRRILSSEAVAALNASVNRTLYVVTADDRVLVQTIAQYLDA